MVIDSSSLGAASPSKPSENLPENLIDLSEELIRVLGGGSICRFLYTANQETAKKFEDTKYDAYSIVLMKPIENDKPDAVGLKNYKSEIRRRNIDLKTVSRIGSGDPRVVSVTLYI